MNICFSKRSSSFGSLKSTVFLIILSTGETELCVWSSLGNTKLVTRRYIGYKLQVAPYSLELLSFKGVIKPLYIP